jgi:hypothetical protein
MLAVAMAGCGTTKGQVATEQLVVSDAVDRAVAAINFQPLAGRNVFLDTQYMKSAKPTGFVNVDYIISSLRQQMLAARCRLVESADAADFVVEARVGALGTDQHDVTYGLPASSGLNAAASLVPGAPPIPLIPEIAIAKRSDQAGAAKIAVFAYHRETRTPVWQSGIAKARSTSKDIWLFGAGPFQRGTVHDRVQFAGEDLSLPLLSDGHDDSEHDPMLAYDREYRFARIPEPHELLPETPGTPAQPASFGTEPSGDEPTANESDPAPGSQ